MIAVRRFAPVTMALAVFASALAPRAAVCANPPPVKLQLEGVLRSQGGSPVPDGVYGMFVRLYAAEKDSEPAWFDALPAVEVQDGLFAVRIGELKPLDGALCSDGDPCTFGEACFAGKCGGGTPGPCACAATADCAALEDGNACNGTLYCDPVAKACAVLPGSVVVCADDGNPCTDAVCDPTSGKCAAQNLPDTSTCSDGKAWTVGDHCQDGACVPGQQTKLCGASADCAAYEDGDLCNGTLFCNKAAGVCLVDPKSVVACPSVDDTACRKNLCQPKTGQCALTPINQNGACDDGNLCTTGEACQAGVCKASAGAGLRAQVKVSGNAIDGGAPKAGGSIAVGKGRTLHVVRAQHRVTLDPACQAVPSGQGIGPLVESALVEVTP